jgi:hypothetical protein
MRISISERDHTAGFSLLDHSVVPDPAEIIPKTRGDAVEPLQSSPTFERASVTVIGLLEARLGLCDVRKMLEVNAVGFHLVVKKRLRSTEVTIATRGIARYQRRRLVLDPAGTAPKAPSTQPLLVRVLCVTITRRDDQTLADEIIAPVERRGSFWIVDEQLVHSPDRRCGPQFV